MTEIAGSVPNDPRWHALQSEDRICPGCGRTHHGLFDLAFDRPVHFVDGGEPGPNRDIWTSAHILTGDFCIIGNEDFFIRCVLELPVLGVADTTFSYGVWSSLSRENFRSYVVNFDAESEAGLGPWFGWFSNRLKGYPETVNLKCRVHPRGGGKRPRIELEPTDHPLAREQHEGLSLDRLFEIYRLNGHAFD